jgi:uncharacterized membrane-anchored protein
MNKCLIWFVVAVAAQLLILAAVPAQKIRARTIGKTIFLKTAPVDPYSIMSGYYVVLGYEISNPTVSSEWKKWPQGKPVWVVLRSDPNNNVWYAISVHDKRPPVPDDCVVIKGKVGASRWRIEYGIESYFIPEDARDKVAQDLRNNSKEAKAEVKVDSSGNAAITKLIIQDRVYEY